MDDAFLDEVNKVEQAAIAASVLPNSLHRQEPRAQERARAIARGAITVPRGDVIVIDDDDDDFEDFKENIPVAKATTSRVNPSRHVDVIDLSD